MPEIIIFSILGLIFGSFSTAAIYRFSNRANNNKSWITGRSACPQCNTKLGATELIPLFSYIIQSGKCKHCQAPIPISYPITELCQAILFLWVVILHGYDLHAAALALASVAIVIITMVDFKSYRIPNAMQIWLLLCAILYHYSLGNYDNWQIYLIGGMFGLFLGWLVNFIYYKIFKKIGMGYGDIKLMGISGFWLGILAYGDFMLISGIAGILIAIPWRKITGKKRIPFGPALVIALWIMLLYRDNFMI